MPIYILIRAYITLKYIPVDKRSMQRDIDSRAKRVNSKTNTIQIKGT